MATIAENLLAIDNEKALQKSALEKQGQDMTNVPYTQYHEKINAIQTGGGGEDMLQQIVDQTNSCYRLFYYNPATDLSLLSRLNVSNVTSMEGMFSNCSNLTDLNLSGWNTSKVTTMKNMFSNSNKLKTINGLGSLNTSAVTDMSYMFQKCYNIYTLDFSLLDTSGVTNMQSMFANCNYLTSVTNLDMISATTTTGMFSTVADLSTLMLKNIKTALSLTTVSSSSSNLSLNSLINTFMELWDFSGASTSYKLTLSVNSKQNIANTYVKLIEVTEEMLSKDPYANNKKPCVVCESTDEGAMTLTEYAVSKNWAIA